MSITLNESEYFSGHPIPGYTLKANGAVVRISTAMKDRLKNGKPLTDGYLIYDPLRGYCMKVNPGDDVSTKEVLHPCAGIYPH